MNQPDACPDCLRRAALLAELGPDLERAAAGRGASVALPLLGLSNTELAEAAAPKLAGRLLARVEAISERRFREELRDAGCWAICRHQPLYPEQLRGLEDAPAALFGRGRLEMLAELELSRTVAVVGSRRASSYGRETARSLANELAAAGVTVLSGLAFGVDSCAHRGALDAGHTVAVLGCGPDIAYPAAHRSLWRRIGEDGLVLSELPPGAASWRWTFPARNRIVAALAGMTVLVEAASRSGSLITAERASEYGRLLGAVPGPVNSRSSAGPNQLLAGGARVVRDAQDVLDAIGGVPTSEWPESLTAELPTR